MNLFNSAHHVTGISPCRFHTFCCPRFCVSSFAVFRPISTVFTMQHFFTVIPHETAVHHYAAVLSFMYWILTEL